MFIVMFLTLTGRKKNVILTSNSKDNAMRLLAPYRANLEANGRIIAYYGKQEMPGSWTEDEFVTKGKVSFRALGAGQSPRGSRNEAIRPDLLLVDDFDTDEDTKIRISFRKGGTGGKMRCTLHVQFLSRQLLFLRQYYC